MSYKWKAGDWAEYGYELATRLTEEDISRGVASFTASLAPSLADCKPVIVRPKPLPKKIKRSELRAWFERQNNPLIDPTWGWDHTELGAKKYRVSCLEYSEYCYGDTLESAILALRKALRKAGKFTP